jgi:hypothetical protein
MELALAPYKGQMGTGQVNAAKFLAAIGGEEAGSKMHFPNLLIKVEDSIVVYPMLYFVDGENLTYVVEIEDTHIATHKVEGAILVFSGLRVGATKASIKASNGEKQEFVITVRNGNGWM